MYFPTFCCGVDCPLLNSMVQYNILYIVICVGGQNNVQQRHLIVLACFIPANVIDYPPSYSSAGVAMEGHLGRPEAGKRFSQYSRRALKKCLIVKLVGNHNSVQNTNTYTVQMCYLALTQGLVCISRAAPQSPCFSEAGGRNPLSAASSSAMALI